MGPDRAPNFRGPVEGPRVSRRPHAASGVLSVTARAEGKCLAALGGGWRPASARRVRPLPDVSFASAGEIVAAARTPSCHIAEGGRGHGWVLLPSDPARPIVSSLPGKQALAGRNLIRLIAAWGHARMETADAHSSAILGPGGSDSHP